MNDALTGHILTRSDFRVPRLATADLTGRQVCETVSRGKHLLTRVDGGVTVHTHLRMDGSWRIRPAGGYPPRDHRVRLVLANSSWQAVGYLLGVVEILPTGQEKQAVGHLGPDLLGPDWDAAEAVRRLRAEPSRPVGEALLDQRNLAGIGNVYKAEVLFLRGINPWRPVGEIDELDALVTLAQRLLDANKERTGHITTGIEQRGQENWVYGRSGRPCRRCGERIQSAGPASSVGHTSSAGHTGSGARTGSAGRPGSGRRAADPQERVTFWCPSCQPAEP